MNEEFPSLEMSNAKLNIELTGRHLVLFEENTSPQKAQQVLENCIGLNCITPSENADSVVQALENISSTDSLYLEKLGIAIVNIAPDQFNKLQALIPDQESPVIGIEAEVINYALTNNNLDEKLIPFVSYLKGYQEAINELSKNLEKNSYKQNPFTEAAGSADLYAKAAASFTWGLQATNALNSRYTGVGVKLCILDTGLDLNHPDFRNRRIISQSFISGQSV